MESMSQHEVDQTSVIDRNGDRTREGIDPCNDCDDASTCTNCSMSEPTPLHHGTETTVISSGTEKTKPKPKPKPKPRQLRRSRSIPKDMRYIQNQDSSSSREQPMQMDPPTVASQPIFSTPQRELSTEDTSSIRTNPTHFMREMISELQQADQSPSRARPFSSSCLSSSPVPIYTARFMRGMLSELQKSEAQSPRRTHNPTSSPFGFITTTPLSKPIVTPGGGANGHDLSFLSLATAAAPPSDTATVDTNTSTTATGCSRTPARSSRSLRSRGNGRLLPFASSHRQQQQQQQQHQHQQQQQREQRERESTTSAATAKRDYEHPAVMDCVSPLSTTTGTDEDSDWNASMRRKRIRSQSVSVSTQDDLSRAQQNAWNGTIDAAATATATPSSSSSSSSAPPSLLLLASESEEPSSTAMEDVPTSPICHASAEDPYASPRYPSTQKSKTTATTQHLSMMSSISASAECSTRSSSRSCHDVNNANVVTANGVPKIATNTSISFVTLRRISAPGNGERQLHLPYDYDYESSQDGGRRAGKSLFSRNNDP